MIDYKENPLSLHNYRLMFQTSKRRNTEAIHQSKNHIQSLQDGSNFSMPKPSKAIIRDQTTPSPSPLLARWIPNTKMLSMGQREAFKGLRLSNQLCIMYTTLYQTAGGQKWVMRQIHVCKLLETHNCNGSLFRNINQLNPPLRKVH